MARLQDLQYYGLAPDLPQSKAGSQLSSVRNMLPREAMERARSLTAVLGTPLHDPRWIQQTRNAGESVIWIYVGPTGIGVVEADVHTDLTPVGWAFDDSDQETTGGVLNSVPFINVGEAPWYWDGTGPFQALPDWPATRKARAMRPYKFQLMALGINEGGTFLEDQVLFSSLAPPGQIPTSWTPAPDNQAGSLECGETRGVLIDGAQIRDGFIAYKESSAYALQYVGGSQIMTKRVLSETVGVLNRNCIAQLSSSQFVLTPGDVVVTDGEGFDSIATNKVQREIFRDANAETLRRSFLVADQIRRELYVCVPAPGQLYPNRAWVYGLDNNQWGQRDLPTPSYHGAQGAFRFAGDSTQWDDLTEVWDFYTDPWDSFTTVQVDFEQIVLSGLDSFVAPDLPTVAPDPDLAGTMTREAIEILPDRFVTVRRVWLEIDAPAGTVLQVELRGYEHQTSVRLQAADATAVGSFIAGSQESVDLLVTGRWFDLSIRSAAGSGDVWRFVQATVEYQPRGRFV